MTLAAILLTAATYTTMVLYKRASALGFNGLASFIAGPVIWTIVCFAIFHGGQQAMRDQNSVDGCEQRWGCVSWHRDTARLIVTQFLGGDYQRLGRVGNAGT